LSGLRLPLDISEGRAPPARRGGAGAKTLATGRAYVTMDAMPAQDHAGKMTPAQFVAKWSPVKLPERAASQEHFIDLCRLLGQPTPAEQDATGAAACRAWERAQKKIGADSLRNGPDLCSLPRDYRAPFSQLTHTQTLHNPIRLAAAPHQAARVTGLQTVGIRTAETPIVSHMRFITPICRFVKSEFSLIFKSNGPRRAASRRPIAASAVSGPS
jgi:hypothetical protein